MDDFLKSPFIRKQIIATMIYVAFKSSRELFCCLESKGLLDWNLVDKEFNPVGHVEALVWAESNGIDVLRNKEHFKHFASNAPAEVMEYLIVERGMTIDYMAENRYLNCSILQMIYKVKGLEEIQVFIRLFVFGGLFQFL